jgi:signal transduction histidine kinase
LKNKVVLMVISLLLHGLVLYDYWFSHLYKLFPPFWSQQYTIAVGVLAFTALALPFLPSAPLQQGLIIIRAGITLALTAPFIPHPGRFGLLYALLIFEGFFYFSGKIAFLFSSIYVSLSGFLIHARPVLWSFTAHRVDVDVMAFIPSLVWCLLAGITGYSFSQEHRIQLAEKDLLKMLRGANLSLAETNISLQDTAAQAELVTTFKERTRIAREIHDSLAYTLTNLTALLNAYSSRFRTKGFEIPDEIKEALILARDGIKDVRQVLRTLRPGENEKYNGLGNIQRLTKVFEQATGIKVTLSFGEVPQFFNEKLEKIIYRVVQEGLTNSFRHGKASEVLVSLHLIGDEGIELIMKDNGCGSAVETDGFGLVGINERVAEVNGKVTIHSKANYGFTLQVWLPFPKGSDNDGSLENNHCG